MAPASMGLAFWTLLFAAFLLTVPPLGERPGVLSTFLLGADLCLLTVALARSRFQLVHILAGGMCFLILSVWTARYLTPELLNWGLGLSFVFAVLHAAFPVLLQRVRPGVSPVWWAHLFPCVALLLVILPLIQQSEASWLIWIFVLMIDLLAIGLAIFTASVLSIATVLALTVLLTAIWILRVPADLGSLTAILFVVGGFAIFFFGLSIVAERFIARKLASGGAANATGGAAPNPQAMLLLQVPALSAVLPFLLLIMVTARLPVVNPTPVFAVALLLVVLLMGVAVAAKLEAVAAVALGGVLAVELAWHAQHFRAAQPWTALAWYGVFYAAFTLFPWVMQKRLEWRVTAWAVAALAGPLHFFLFHRALASALGTAWIGLLPATFALPMLAGLFYLARKTPGQHPNRNALLAWFGGSALFFITLIFPVQFRREWLTVGWALEGAALLWLFHRVPHPGLRATGVVLLAIAFVRLSLNPAVLSYHQRSGTPLLNWYLYAYGIVTACLLTGARLLAPPRNRLWNVNISAALYSLGTILCFLLVNIEIADYFNTDRTLVFEFSGNFARDMAYSIAWALFALGLLLIGFRKRAAAARYASLGLLSLTLLKLFFHDLSQLAQLYRIGAFIAVAIILILASFLYQRFFAQEVASASAPRNDQKA
jgi:hypothetical protein